ncbi:MAG: DAK2 domain-containing protein [Xanthomonadales bacterium]|nr:DAK2 domain-containing protein [Xanthomonadales bacterium]
MSVALPATALPEASTAGPRISAAALRRALIAGVRRVIARREQLNRINVFPVPDGDTGSNLAFTLSSVLDGALSRPARQAGTLLRAVADDALDGARGNSGAIMAQFFHGLGERVGSLQALSPAQLAAAVRNGAEQARGALSEPREGTVLSVIQAFSDALQQPASSLRDWFDAALQRSRRALANTPNQLAVLRQAGVVDAGAQGFVDLLEGVADFISEGRPAARRVAADEDDDAQCHDAVAVDSFDSEANPEHRWCSECVIEAESDAGIDRESLRAAIDRLGSSSVVLAGGGQRLRLHAHVACPGRLFELAGGFGRVAQRKADDMRAQQRAVKNPAAVAVVTDSGADLPADWIERSGLGMVPVRLNFGDEDFLDKVTMHPAEFYARLRAIGDAERLPQTSQPTPGDFRRQFEFLGSHHAEVVYVGISRPLSGTLQSAESLQSRLHGVALRVIDSGHASCGEGLLAMAAGEAARDGADGSEIVALIERLRSETFTFAATRDLSHAVRGGRIPRWAAPLARWLPVTPVAAIRADGRLGVAGVLPGRNNVPERLAAWIMRRLPPGRRWRLLVGHGDCEADGVRLRDELAGRLGDCEAGLVEAGPAVGAHAGPGALVVGVQRLG